MRPLSHRRLQKAFVQQEILQDLSPSGNFGRTLSTIRFWKAFVYPFLYSLYPVEDFGRSLCRMKILNDPCPIRDFARPLTSRRFFKAFVQ